MKVEAEKLGREANIETYAFPVRAQGQRRTRSQEARLEEKGVWSALEGARARVPTAGRRRP